MRSDRKYGIAHRFSYLSIYSFNGLDREMSNHLCSRGSQLTFLFLITRNMRGKGADGWREGLAREERLHY